MEKYLPKSHCKFCKEEAQDCECLRGKHEWMPSFTDDKLNVAGILAQRKLLKWIIEFQKINPLAIGITHTVYLESMFQQLGGKNV